MNSKKRLQASLLIAGACASLLLISVQYTRADLIEAPAAPTELIAVYSTIPNGPEIQLTVRDNAANETWQCLYWHASGSAWPGTSCVPNVFTPPTWSMPANVGGMQIAAPRESGTYEYLLWACNSAGCTSSNIASVQVPNISPPAAPSNLRLDPPLTASAVFLKWDDNSSNEDKFTVDRKFSTDANYAGTLHWAEVSSNVTSFSDTNIVPGQRYDYRVQACNAIGCSASLSLTGVEALCASLDFALLDNKTSYTVGENVNYSFKCLPAGTKATSVAIQVVKPDGTATTYVTHQNIGAVPQKMDISTSNLTNGSYMLRACLNDRLCGTGSWYSIPFTVAGGTVTATNPPATVQSSSSSSSLRPATGSSSLVTSSSSPRSSFSSPSSLASCGSNNEIRASCQCGSKAVTFPSSVGEKYCCTVNGYTYSTSVICPALQTPATATGGSTVTGTSPSVTTPGTTNVSGSASAPVSPPNPSSTSATALPALPGIPGAPSSVVPVGSQQTPTASVPVYKKLSASKMRVLRSRKKSMLRELLTLERTFKILKDDDALEQLTAFRADLEAFVPLDTSANETMADFQDELVQLRLQVPTKQAKDRK